MRITIWVTDHPFSQRIAMSLKLGFKDDAVLATSLNYTQDAITATDVHIGYGVRRRMAEVYRDIAAVGRHWFNIDLGYFGAAHFDGQYRIAYKGTQNAFDKQVQSESCPEYAEWKTGGAYALICPPTESAADFFNINQPAWLERAQQRAVHLSLIPKIRRKDDPEKLEDAFATSGAVITFNSSVAWKALQLGIPAFSDVAHSTVGSWHGLAQTLEDIKSLSREQLFRFMCANQLSLLDMQQGRLLPILKRLIS